MNQERTKLWYLKNLDIFSHLREEEYKMIDRYRITVDKRAIRVVALLLVAAPGVVATAEGASFDYRHYESLLSRRAKSGVAIDSIVVTAVDYTALVAESKRPDSDYSALLKELAVFDPETRERQDDKKAFWINVYNIAAIKTIVDHYPVDSIRSRKISWSGLPWNRKIITVGGKEYSLSEVEDDILLDGFQDLRIHFAVNCASVSCIDLALTPYRGETLSARLEEQGRKFLADRREGLRLDREKKTLFLSQVFKFDRKHFEGLGGGTLPFISPFLAQQDRQYLSTEKVTVEYLDYNWRANDIKNAD
jgi:hypothetical protein